jgi:hypothetical protein
MRAATTPNGSTPATTQAPAKHFKIKDTVKVGDTYLVVNISLTNLSNQEQSISSALNFTLQDSTGQKYDESIDTNAGATPDGKVAAGSPLRGSVAYEVPSSTKKFTLSFAPDITSSGQSIWDLSL